MPPYPLRYLPPTRRAPERRHQFLFSPKQFLIAEFSLQVIRRHHMRPRPHWGQAGARGDNYPKGGFDRALFSKYCFFQRMTSVIFISMHMVTSDRSSQRIIDRLTFSFLMEPVEKDGLCSVRNQKRWINIYTIDPCCRIHQLSVAG